MANLKERAIKIVVEQLGVDESEVTETAHINDDLGADSLDQVELIMALEEEFDVEIPDEDAEKLVTIGSLLSYFEGKVEELSCDY